MAEIAWTAEAQQWLESIFEHIAEDNPQAATRTVQAIYDRAQDLIHFPRMGYRYAASSRHVRICSTNITELPICSKTMGTSIFWASFTDRSTLSVINSEMTHNHAFERTSASALRLLAVPSSLRSSAAAQRDR